MEEWKEFFREEDVVDMDENAVAGFLRCLREVEPGRKRVMIDRGISRGISVDEIMNYVGGDLVYLVHRGYLSAVELVNVATDWDVPTLVEACGLLTDVEGVDRVLYEKLPHNTILSFPVLLPDYVDYMATKGYHNLSLGQIAQILPPPDQYRVTTRICAAHARAFQAHRLGAVHQCRAFVGVFKYFTGMTFLYFNRLLEDMLMPLERRPLDILFEELDRFMAPPLPCAPSLFEVIRECMIMVFLYAREPPVLSQDLTGFKRGLIDRIIVHPTGKDQFFFKVWDLTLAMVDPRHAPVSTCVNIPHALLTAFYPYFNLGHISDEHGAMLMSCLSDLVPLFK